MSLTALLSINWSYWLLQTVAMMLTCALIPKLRVSGPFWAFVTVITLAFINSKVWDAALFFEIPNTFTIQTVSLFLVNGLIFWVVVKLLPGIEVDGLVPALVAPVVFTFLSLIISEYHDKIDWSAVFNFLLSILQEVRTFVQTNADSKFGAISSM